MDFRITNDQLDLQSAIRQFCEGRVRIDPQRPWGDVLRATWSELGDLGVFALRVAEKDGGLELGMAEAVLVYEELGAALVPGPLVACGMAAGHVPGVSDGSVLVGFADFTDTMGPVEHLDVLDLLWIRRGDDLFEVDPSEVTASRVAVPLDPFTPVGVVVNWPRTESAGPFPDLKNVVLAGMLLTSAFQVGIARAVLDRTLEHVVSRRQFGVPIGSFQVPKHMAADMLVRVELARAAVHAAAVTFDDVSVGNPVETAHAAKLLADRAAIENALVALQLHGGMGFSWEVGLHLFLKRAWVLTSVFGNEAENALQLADFL